MPIVREIKAKSLLNKSKVFDYCVNAYTGCQHDCQYCYARLFMRRYSGHVEPWWEFVDVKINAPEVLRKQLLKAKRGTVWISSVCDPYQPLETKYRLTRQCLEELLKVQFPVNIQTKSKLVGRDLDIIKRFENIEVTITIATNREDMATLFEPKASSIKERLETLEFLHLSGIHTSVFVGPILPGNPEKLASQIHGIADRVLIDKMNYMSTIRGFYKKHDLESATKQSYFYEYKKRFIQELRKKHIPIEEIF